ncbi:MAG: DUF2207 domain-containing protein [Bacilli bacterium]|nr:DUF2207 domain-containing protein [Bacilli bacterium]
MKKIILFISLLIFPFLANASSISKVDMDIVLSNNGKAIVTETWDANVTDGTEGWHPYYNIGKSEINVISASMDGHSYQVVDFWNENSSLSSKAYKAGIYKPDSNETDIVFGITSYGSHTYVIKYEITNFISNLSDADMIYWTLFPYDFSAQPDNVTIKISGPYKYPDTLDVWGFGMYDAPCYVKDGAIYMTSDGPIGSGEYLTLLAKFPKGKFESNSILDHNFEYYLNMAQEGATPSIHKTEKKKSKLSEIFGKIAGVLMGVGLFIVASVTGSRAAKNNKYNFGEAGKKIKDVPNFRDIPCDKDIYYAFWTADTYELIKNRNDFLGAVLLKWIHDGNVTVEKIETKVLFKTREESVVTFVKKPLDANAKEQDLYDYMLEASGDGKLETDEFKKWCKKNYTKIFNWFDDCIKFERDELIDRHLIVKNEYEGGKIFKYKYQQYDITSKAREEAEKLQGLKQFFKEFSRINEKEPIEVKLWNEYLMFAQILGMADEVMKQFRKLYPEVLTEMENYNYNYDAFLFANSLSSEGVKAASAARSAAESYSSGGGGFSSGGGGGGSFGGGGGGGGFR